MAIIRTNRIGPPLIPLIAVKFLSYLENLLCFVSAHERFSLSGEWSRRQVVRLLRQEQFL